MSDRLCVNCKFYKFVEAKFISYSHLCYAKKVEEKIDLVTGEIYKTSSFLGHCYELRKRKEDCGPLGELFQEKENG